MTDDAPFGGASQNTGPVGTPDGPVSAATAPGSTEAPGFASRAANGQVAAAPSGAAAQLPAVVLPTGGGAIRSIGEKFDVNPVTGTASLSIPLPMTPGRFGFTPQLALVYDSGTGNGPYGLGFTLPYGSITRKTDKGLPVYDDEHESDVFMLVGAEDLVPVRTERGEVSRRERRLHGKVYQVTQYRPRIEGLFARIERWCEHSTGISHWRTISRENVTTVYGTDQASQIADPGDPRRVFSYLISATWNDKGNACVYTHVCDDGAGIDGSAPHEANRTAARRRTQRYLKSVRYGNRHPYFANWDEGGNAAELPEHWHFNLVVDYGDHNADAPCPWPDRAWPVRPDPFSTYRAGFEVRTYRRARRFLMFHDFPDESSAGAHALVRSISLAYRDERELSGRVGPVYSQLAAVTQTGHRREGHGYLSRSLPPLELAYSELEIHPEILGLDPASAANLPEGLLGHYQLIDLDGEGLSGVLVDDGQTLAYKRNLSVTNRVRLSDGKLATRARFGPLRDLHTLPGTIPTGRRRLLDLDGSGKIDVVDLPGVTPGYYRRAGQEGWEPFRPFRSLPNIDWDDPEVRFVDLTGDGLADVLAPAAEAFQLYRSLGTEGFAEADRRPPPWAHHAGAPSVIQTGDQEMILFADMSGDGLSDLVRVHNGEVCYWPNTGYASFGAKVTMDRSPWFTTGEEFDPQRIRCADIDGTGTSDLLYVGCGGVRAWFNESGNGWSDPVRLDVPTTDRLSDVQVADLLGTGTACLIWSSPLPGNPSGSFRYVDLLGGRKPHLLVRVCNNLGAETRMTYAPSTRFYLADEEAGRPWRTRLPFVVHVLERHERFDFIGRSRTVARYAYHHGYFDPIEREFRGFGMVERFDTDTYRGETLFPDAEVHNWDERSFSPPVRTRTWYHTGTYEPAGVASRYEEEYWGEPSGTGDRTTLPPTRIPGDLDPANAHEAWRGLKGQVLRTEVYADDGTALAASPYSVVEHNYAIRLRQPIGRGRHAIVQVLSRETLELHYERDTCDPRVSHALTLEIDRYDNVLRSVKVAYPRRETGRRPEPGLSDQFQRMLAYDQGRMHVLATHSHYTNALDDPIGRPEVNRTPAPSSSTVAELRGIEAQRDLEGGDHCPRTSPRLFTVAELDRIWPRVWNHEHEIPYEQVASQDILGDGPLPVQPTRRTVQRTCTRFRSDDLERLLAPGELEPLGLPGETYTYALTPGLRERLPVDDEVLLEAGYVRPAHSGSWWAPSGRLYFSADADTPAQERTEARAHFYLVRRATDPFGAVTRLSYDPYDLAPASAIDPVGNMTTATINYRVLQPSTVTDPNGNRSALAFDALGRVIATAAMGKPDEHVGDSLDGIIADPDEAEVLAHFAHPLHDPETIIKNATTRNLFDAEAYWRTRHEPHPAPPAVYTITRETHAAERAPGQTMRYQHQFSYTDGLGRAVQLKSRAAPGPLAPGGERVSPRWIGSSWTIYNNKDQPVRVYEPFFTRHHRFEFAVRHGVSTITFYDPPGRPVAVLHPDQTWEKIVFDAWHQQVWDQNDTVLRTDPRTDPDVGPYFRRLLGPDPAAYTSWYDQRIGGLPGASTEVSSGERDAAEKAAAHAGTPTVKYLDSLGQSCLTVADNGQGRCYPTRIVFDVVGAMLAVYDALGRRVLECCEHLRADDGGSVFITGWDLDGRQLYASTMDGGARRGLQNVAGNAVRAWDARGFAFRTVYDLAQRATHRFVSCDGGPEAVFERDVFGEGQPDRNLCGRLWRQYDTGGLAVTGRCDFKGNIVMSARHLARDPRGFPDWSALSGLTAREELDEATAPLLEPGGPYLSITAYDALDRPTQTVMPHREGSWPAVLQPGYDDGGAVDRLDVWLEQHAVPTTLLEPDTADLRPVTALTYNAKGQPLDLLQGNNAITIRSYDPKTFRLSQVKTERAGPFSPAERIVQDLRFFYDPVANITRIRDDADIHDVVFFRNRRVDPSNDYTYDPIYRLIEATGREHLGQAGARLAPPVQVTADDSARMRLPQPGDGKAMGRYTERYDYDPVGNLMAMIHRVVSGSWIRRYHYGERSQIDPAQTGNRLTATSLPGDPVSGPYSARYSYDAHGSMTTTPNLASITWDALGRLASSSRQHVLSGTPDRTFYAYDAVGNRLRKATDRHERGSRPGARLRERIYLGSFELYREYGPDGSTVKLARTTLRLSVGSQPVAIVETRTHGAGRSPARIVRYQYRNQVGSAVLELDADARILTYEEYFPFGSTSYQAVSSLTETPKRYRYIGKERDEETGFYYLGARYYCSWLGRWTSCDPLGILAAVNDYRYVGDNPVTLSDPTGTTGEKDYGGTLPDGGKPDPDSSSYLPPPKDDTPPANPPASQQPPPPEGTPPDSAPKQPQAPPPSGGPSSPDPTAGMPSLGAYTPEMEAQDRRARTMHFDLPPSEMVDDMVSSPLSYLAYSLIYHIKHDVQALIEPRMMLNSTGQMVPSPARDKSAELAAVIGDAAMFADPELLAEEPLAAGTSAFDITVAEGRPIVRLPELNVNVSGPGGTAGGPLPDLPAAVGRETYATAGPLVNRSGWGAKSQIPGYGTPAVDAWRYYEEIGVKLRPHRFDFPGTPGTYFASHAEPQALFMNPGADFMEVTRAPCPSCQDLISGEAVRRGWTIVVLSPRGFRWFFPNGMIWP